MPSIRGPAPNLEPLRSEPIELREERAVLPHKLADPDPASARIVRAQIEMGKATNEREARSHPQESR